MALVIKKVMQDIEGNELYIDSENNFEYTFDNHSFNRRWRRAGYNGLRIDPGRYIILKLETARNMLIYEEFEKYEENMTLVFTNINCQIADLIPKIGYYLLTHIRPKIDSNEYNRCKLLEPIDFSSAISITDGSCNYILNARKRELNAATIFYHFKLETIVPQHRLICNDHNSKIWTYAYTDYSNIGIVMENGSLNSIAARECIDGLSFINATSIVLTTMMDQFIRESRTYKL